MTDKIDNYMQNHRNISKSLGSNKTVYINENMKGNFRTVFLSGQSCRTFQFSHKDNRDEDTYLQTVVEAISYQLCHYAFTIDGDYDFVDLTTVKIEVIVLNMLYWQLVNGGNSESKNMVAIFRNTQYIRPGFNKTVLSDRRTMRSDDAMASYFKHIRKCMFIKWNIISGGSGKLYSSNKLTLVNNEEDDDDVCF